MSDTKLIRDTITIPDHFQFSSSSVFLFDDGTEAIRIDGTGKFFVRGVEMASDAAFVDELRVLFMGHHSLGNDDRAKAKALVEFIEHEHMVAGHYECDGIQIIVDSEAFRELQASLEAST